DFENRYSKIDYKDLSLVPLAIHSRFVEDLGNGRDPQKNKIALQKLSEFDKTVKALLSEDIPGPTKDQEKLCENLPVILALFKSAYNQKNKMKQQVKSLEELNNKFLLSFIMNILSGNPADGVVEQIYTRFVNTNMVLATVTEVNNITGKIKVRFG